MRPFPWFPRYTNDIIWYQTIPLIPEVHKRHALIWDHSPDFWGTQRTLFAMRPFPWFLRYTNDMVWYQTIPLIPEGHVMTMYSSMSNLQLLSVNGDWSPLCMNYHFDNLHWDREPGLDTYFLPNLAVGQPSNNMDLSEIEFFLAIIIFSLWHF